MSEESYSLRARGLVKTYSGRRVVNNISLNLNQSQIVGLLGPNGAGKTTSFYMMVGLVKADEGEITIGGQNITKEPIHRRALRGVGYLPQEASVFRELSVWDNIYCVVEGFRISKSEKKMRVEKLIEEFGLGHIITSKGASLSGGERRRVEIARALALNPKFILLDEPFAGVDPLAVNDIQNVIRGLKEKNIGVLITDHNVRETLGIVDEAYIMNSGELLVNGTPEEVLNSEKARKFYLGSQFRL